MRSLPQVSVTSVAARRLDRNIYLLHNLIAHVSVLVDVPLMNDEIRSLRWFHNSLQ